MLSLRARHAGHVIVNTATDRPWSQYFCCMVAGNREYVRRYPVATKRVLRAILEIGDIAYALPREQLERRTGDPADILSWIEPDLGGHQGQQCGRRRLEADALVLGVVLSPIVVRHLAQGRPSVVRVSSETALDDESRDPRRLCDAEIGRL
jgi:ABC-type nitrate/sulfonate/bicarbonate transport system substrate-binding protein